jgi:hypothetical protein
MQLTRTWKDKTQWHLWWAWRPVVVDEGTKGKNHYKTRVWGDWVWRKFDWNFFDSPRSYKTKESLLS